MRLFVVVLGLAVVAPWQVVAQPVSGLYVAGSAGINLRSSQTITTEQARPAPSLKETNPSFGAAAVGGLGYGFGNGWRMEIEGGRRR